ncbi:MAG: M23 family metallopeptidase [Patescibacteria group bacterium]
MRKHPIAQITTLFIKYWSYFAAFLTFFYLYIKNKVLYSSRIFENYKNGLVKLFMMKRGRYSRSFLHLAIMGVLGLGVMLAPFLASTYPVFSNAASVSALNSPSQNQSIIVGEDVIKTDISQKPRDKAITYKVEKGDTVSTIANKFGISTDTIKWENGLTNDNIGIGDELIILPVSGMSHKVVSGDTVYSIAKKYDTEAQRIVDFPFNDFANLETFSLVVGQILIVPDGVKPAAIPSTPRRQTYIASGPVSVSSAGFTWPVRGTIGQFASWYHMALDILAPMGTPIIAANTGTVSNVVLGSYDGGYGNNIYVTGDDGTITHYAHMSGANASVGDKVTAGKSVVGWIGMTGRTTGPHVHFEIRRNGSLVNPLSYLQ